LPDTGAYTVLQINFSLYPYKMNQQDALFTINLFQ
jgi:hypothetical protein